MKTRILYCAMISLAVGASATLAQQGGLPSDKTPTAPSPKVAENMGDKLQQLGSQQADEKTAGEVRTMLARLVNDAVTEGQFHAVLSDLAKADQDRIGDMPREKFDEVNKAIVQLRRDFREKYHQEFDFKPEYLNHAEINLGSGKDAVTVSLSDLEKNAAVKPIVAGTGAVPDGPLTITHGPVARDKNIPAETGMSLVSGPTLNVVNEAHEVPAWKVDIPNEIGGQQLRDSLTRHIQKIDDQKIAWSDDVNVTARAVASQVFQALTDASIASDQ